MKYRWQNSPRLFNIVYLTTGSILLSLNALVLLDKIPVRYLQCSRDLTRLAVNIAVKRRKPVKLSCVFEITLLRCVISITVKVGALHRQQQRSISDVDKKGTKTACAFRAPSDPWPSTLPCPTTPTPTPGYVSKPDDEVTRQSVR